MASLVWTRTAKQDLKEISDYIALENKDAADKVVDRIYEHVKLLEKHPFSGTLLPELEYSRYLQLVEPPCRIFYEVRTDQIYVMHILRFERILRISRLDDID